MAEQQQQLQRRQRVYRQQRDVFNKYNDDELIQHFRMNRAGIITVADLVRDKLQSRTERNQPLSPETKVAITLRYLATGKMQQCSSDDFGISQTTISRVITQTIDALSEPDIVTQFVKFPLTRQEVQVKQVEFMEDYRFPGVVGTIDGTHIRIVAPSVDEHLYVNRKRYHSINVQIVFDAKYRILDVLARWPGSVHDARILDESGLKALFEQNYVPAGCYLLGDSGYPCKEWLLTPYLNPLAGVQTNYNTAHKRTRCVVERGIGQLKRQFHVLHGEVRLSPEKTCKIVYVCALLHNMCKQFNIPVPINEEDELFHDAAEGDVGADEEEPGEAEIPSNPGRPAGRNRHPFRDYIANLHFSRPVAE
ncbi:putative nuclease HARBI1 [Scylla paramamosain]|uniref:putative nuclease HARBI1 n=1 Tax=Scylla paramamosain TaxID=85552 RepID=UPI003083AAF6